ncbi:hypothetical protein [Lacticaseibacillus porcinae]|uniref:hypothetical protein n=1 Tax=Lacticaseibacillus porcinae TaxID=1123687 RepID=UPI000F7A687C|nr:hypothetical protein [Lacticaseibacillus porcinae]
MKAVNAMLWIILLVVFAIVYFRYRSWFETPKGRLTLDVIILAIVAVLALFHGFKGSMVMWIEGLIALVSIYDAVIQIRQLRQK